MKISSVDQFVVGWDSCGNGIEFDNNLCVYIGKEELETGILDLLKSHEDEINEEDDWSDYKDRVCIFRLTNSPIKFNVTEEVKISSKLKIV